jgi:glycosyltransferase involved in cell wall biosynthesis
MKIMLRRWVIAVARSGVFGRARFLRRMADLRRDDKRWPEAAALYGEYLRLKPTDAAIWVQFGHALKESGRLGEAEEAYRKALVIRPSLADTHLQLGYLLRIRGRMEEALDAFDRAMELDQTQWPENVDRQEYLETGKFDCFSDSASEANDPVLQFDVSDLLSYFRAGRLPTGIQRVQMETIAALLRKPEALSDTIGICAFTEGRDRWIRIPGDLFLSACELSLAGGDMSDAAWVVVVEEVVDILQRSRPMKFGRGAVLVNLGTSWLQNYILNVRNVKEQFSVRYAPFVHDLVPIITPQHNVRELSEDFVAWLLGILEFSDHFLVNSKSTRSDLLSAAARLGRQIPDDKITVVPLDADFRKSNSSPSNPGGLQKWGLSSSRYVLFVATIEPRKNHVGAFSAWLALLKRHGATDTPKLVCVGKEGWMNSAVYAKLNESGALRAQVIMLSKVSDEELSLLYDQCLFTLYPSHYEGWGLPVTESLCHGKIPLIPATSSLPEAGGEFADYFEADSETSMVRSLEQLIFDERYRSAREQNIREKYHPRSWMEIGEQVEQAVAHIRRLPRTWSRAIVTARLGVFYPIRRNRDVEVRQEMNNGDLFRAGDGWLALEDWGGWTRPGGAEIALLVKGPHRRLNMHILLHGLRAKPTGWKLEVDPTSGISTASGTIAPKERKWVSFEIPNNEVDSVVRVVIVGDKSQYISRFPGSNQAKLTSVGCGGFCICEAEDILVQENFAKVVALGELAQSDGEIGVRNSQLSS